MTPEKNPDNDVNDSIQSLERVAFGRGGSKASSVVNKRNPCNKEEHKEKDHKEEDRGIREDKRKERLKIGTWNVRTMRRPGKLTNVIGEMRKADLDILGLSEVRWREEGDFVSEGVRVIYTGGEESKNGVAILLGERVAKCVDKVERQGDRMIVVTVRAHPVNIVIMQVYMPTTTHEEEEVDSIYEMIEEKLENTKGNDYVIVMGDWNASVGEGGHGKCVGEYGLGKKNERGEKLIEFCKRQQLMITNTWFQQEKRRTYTWKAPGDGARYQLDYIMARQRYRHIV